MRVEFRLLRGENETYGRSEVWNFTIRHMQGRENMTISERLFEIMHKKEISGYRLSKMTGISRQTIFDWHKKNTNPGADKIMVICEALQITPEELLVGKPSDENQELDQVHIVEDIEMQIMKECQELSDAKKRRLLAYVSMLQNAKE